MLDKLKSCGLAPWKYLSRDKYWTITTMPGLTQIISVIVHFPYFCYTVSMTDIFIELEHDIISPNPLQPRGAISTISLKELADSIKANGILEPLVVAHTPAGYQIIAGERRWRAAKIAGLTHVPVIVKKVNQREMLVLSIVENLHREDLNVLEEAAGYRKLADDFNLTLQQISDKMGLAVPTISNRMRLLRLPDSIKQALVDGKIQEGHAKSLVGLEDPNLIFEVFSIVTKKKLSISQTEELCRRYQQEERQNQRVLFNDEAKKIEGKQLSKLENVFSKKLDCKTRIVKTKHRVKVEFTFPNDEKLDFLLKQLADTSLDQL
jgi:ParB family transcriptional regulator, chromosome partitioning protein